MRPTRHQALLRERYRAILGYTGLVLLIAAGVILSTLLALPFYPRELGQARAFLVPGGILAVLGAATLAALPAAAPGPPSRWQEGAVVVVLAWAGRSILAAAGVFMAAPGLTFTQAVFEATSGWTTTGLSVVDVTKASHLVLLFRSDLELAGRRGPGHHHAERAGGAGRRRAELRGGPLATSSPRMSGAPPPW